MFRIGKGVNSRDIDIKACYEALGPERSGSLLGFHVFTGCDQTGRFCGESKSTWWHCYIHANRDVYDSLAKIGNVEALPSLETIECLEKFVVKFYKRTRGFDSTSLGDLRWFLFSKFQNDAEKLPPTFSALKYKIF